MSQVMVTPASMSARAKIGLLLAAAGLMWLLMAGPAYWLRGTLGLEGLTYAGLLCLIPGWLVVYVTTRYPDAGSQGNAVLLGTGLRMAFVLVGMLVIKDLRPDLGYYGFQLWLILYYLAFLFVETLLVVKYTGAQKN